MTAVRPFKKVFREYTGLDWGARATTTPIKGAKFKYVLPSVNSNPAQYLEDGIGQQRKKNQSQVAAAMIQPSQTVVLGDELPDSQSPKTLKRLEAKIAQRALDAQFDNKVLATDTATYDKRKVAQDSASEEDEPPSKLRKSQKA